MSASDQTMRARVIEVVSVGKISDVSSLIMKFQPQEYITARQTFLDLISEGVLQKGAKGHFAVNDEVSDDVATSPAPLPSLDDRTHETPPQAATSQSAAKPKIAGSMIAQTDADRAASSGDEPQAVPAIAAAEMTQDDIDVVLQLLSGGRELSVKELIDAILIAEGEWNIGRARGTIERLARDEVIELVGDRTRGRLGRNSRLIARIPGAEDAATSIETHAPDDLKSSTTVENEPQASADGMGDEAAANEGATSTISVDPDPDYALQADEVSTEPQVVPEALPHADEETPEKPALEKAPDDVDELQPEIKDELQEEPARQMLPTSDQARRIFGALAEIKDRILVKLRPGAIQYDALVEELADEPAHGVARAVVALLADHAVIHDRQGRLAIHARAPRVWPTLDEQGPRERRKLPSDELEGRIKAILAGSGTTHISYLKRDIAIAELDDLAGAADALAMRGEIVSYGHGFYTGATPGQTAPAAAPVAAPVAAETSQAEPTELSPADKHLSTELSQILTLIRKSDMTPADIGRHLGMPRGRANKLCEDLASLGFASFSRGGSTERRLIHHQNLARWEMRDLADAPEVLVAGSLRAGACYLRKDLVEHLEVSQDELNAALAPMIKDGRIVEIPEVKAIRVLVQIAGKPTLAEPPVATVARHFQQRTGEALNILYERGPQTTLSLARLLGSDPWWTPERIVTKMASLRPNRVSVSRDGDLVLGPFCATTIVHAVGEKLGQPKLVQRRNDEAFKTGEAEMADIAAGMLSRMESGKAYARAFIPRSTAGEEALVRLERSGEIKLLRFAAMRDALIICTKKKGSAELLKGKPFAPITLASACEKFATAIIPVILKRGFIAEDQVRSEPMLQDTAWTHTRPGHTLEHLAGRGVLTRSHRGYVLSEETAVLIDLIRMRGDDPDLGRQRTVAPATKVVRSSAPTPARIRARIADAPRAMAPTSARVRAPEPPAAADEQDLAALDATLVWGERQVLGAMLFGRTYRLKEVLDVARRTAAPKAVDEALATLQDRGLVQVADMAFGMVVLKLVALEEDPENDRPKAISSRRA